MVESRSKKTMRNMMVAFAMQIVSIVLTFACRTVFAQLLAKEYLGLSGLFTNIISVLSLSELGLGSVIIVNLYKPLAENDEERICKLMNFYKNAYHVIGTFIILCGIALMPFIQYLVKTDTDIPYLRWYFLLFILQSASSYFFAYKQSILTASQNEYICSIIRQILNILMNVLQIVFLLLTELYVTYLLVSIFTSLSTNIVISVIADRKFPYLRAGKRKKLLPEERRGMFSNVSSMMIHKVGNVVINSTDNILISAFIGIIYAGLYSNYILIINAVTQVVTIVFNAVSASIGDFNAQKSREEVKELHDVMYTVGTWLFGMCAICFCVLFQPTISIWLGEDFLLDFSIVLVISLNFLFSGMFRTPSTFIDVSGLYVKTKFKPILMAAINLVSSLILLHFFGLLGVFLGTLLSYLLVGLWVDPYYLYRYRFEKPLYRYWLSLVGNLAVIFAIGAITYTVVHFIPYYVLKVIACVVISNGLFFIRYFKTREFKYIFVRIKGLFKIKNRKTTN